MKVLRSITSMPALRFTRMASRYSTYDCIIDQTGIVRYLHSGYDPYSMKKILNELLLTDIQNDNPEKNLLRNLNLQLFPNPTNSHLKVEFNAVFPGEYRLTIYDIGGRKVHSRSIRIGVAGKQEVGNTHLIGNPSGIYLVTVQSGYLRQTEKLILIR